MVRCREGRQAIGGDEHHLGLVALRGCMRREARNARLVGFAAEVRASQIVIAIGRGARGVERFETCRAKRIGERGGIERFVYGVARLRVGEFGSNASSGAVGKLCVRCAQARCARW